MSEKQAIQNSSQPITKSILIQDLQKLGVQKEDIILVHSSLNRLGWVVGGAQTVISALMGVVGNEGTIVMPTHTSANSEPRYWQHPPVPQSWYPIIRNTMPAFDPEITPTRQMGIIPETFRKYPGVYRSTHPQVSFAAWGKSANEITTNHSITPAMGKGSPLEKIYTLGGKILLLGVDHNNNTILHFAETQSSYQVQRETQGAAIIENGDRKWVTWEDLKYQDEDFLSVGQAYEKNIGYIPQKVGEGTAKLFMARKLVDFAIQWMNSHR